MTPAHVESWLDDHACPVCGDKDWESQDYSMWQGYSDDLCLNCHTTVRAYYSQVRVGADLRLPGLSEFVECDALSSDEMQTRYLAKDYKPGVSEGAK